MNAEYRRNPRSHLISYDRFECFIGDRRCTAQLIRPNPPIRLQNADHTFPRFPSRDKTLTEFTLLLRRLIKIQKPSDQYDDSARILARSANKESTIFEIYRTLNANHINELASHFEMPPCQWALANVFAKTNNLRIAAIRLTIVDDWNR